jgi:hypothetical protein
MSVAEMKLVIVIAKMIGADATCCVACTSTSFGGYAGVCHTECA